MVALDENSLDVYNCVISAPFLHCGVGHVKAGQTGAVQYLEVWLKRP